MIQMSTSQSWGTMLLLALLVGAIIWAAIEMKLERDKRLAARIEKIQNAGSTATDERLAPVTDLRTRRRIRHLTLVEDSPRDKSLELYDWQQSGI